MFCQIEVKGEDNIAVKKFGVVISRSKKPRDRVPVSQM